MLNFDSELYVAAEGLNRIEQAIDSATGRLAGANASLWETGGANLPLAEVLAALRSQFGALYQQLEQHLRNTPEPEHAPEAEPVKQSPSAKEPSEPAVPRGCTAPQVNLPTKAQIPIICNALIAAGGALPMPQIYRAVERHFPVGTCLSKQGENSLRDIVNRKMQKDLRLVDLVDGAWRITEAGRAWVQGQNGNHT